MSTATVDSERNTVDKLNETAKKQIHVLYHYPCPDGVYAMLAAYLYWHRQKDAGMKMPDHEFSLNNAFLANV